MAPVCRRCSWLSQPGKTCKPLATSSKQPRLPVQAARAGRGSSRRGSSSRRAVGSSWIVSGVCCLPDGHPRCTPGGHGFGWDWVGVCSPLTAAGRFPGSHIDGLEERRIWGNLEEWGHPACQPSCCVLRRLAGSLGCGSALSWILILPLLPQEFDIPPTLCVGGCLRVELLGKRQRQAADDAYYSERPAGVCCCVCLPQLAPAAATHCCRRGGACRTCCCACYACRAVLACHPTMHASPSRTC